MSEGHFILVLSRDHFIEILSQRHTIYPSDLLVQPCGWYITKTHFLELSSII